MSRLNLSSQAGCTLRKALLNHVDHSMILLSAFWLASCVKCVPVQYGQQKRRRNWQIGRQCTGAIHVFWWSYFLAPTVAMMSTHNSGLSLCPIMHRQMRRGMLRIITQQLAGERKRNPSLSPTVMLCNHIYCAGGSWLHARVNHD